MNTKLLTIVIALVILAMVVAPVAAEQPRQTVIAAAAQNPNAGTASVWTAINDLIAKIANLQTQINNLKTKVANIPAGAQGPTGPPGPKGDTGAAGATVHFGEYQTIAVDPASGVYVSMPAKTDGFVTCFCAGSTGVDVKVDGLVDGNTVVGSSAPPISDGYAHVSITLPVQQGHPWSLRWVGCKSILRVKWIPLSA